MTKGLDSDPGTAHSHFLAPLVEESLCKVWLPLGYEPLTLTVLFFVDPNSWGWHLAQVLRDAWAGWAKAQVGVILKAPPCAPGRHSPLPLHARR